MKLTKSEASRTVATLRQHLSHLLEVQRLNNLLVYETERSIIALKKQYPDADNLKACRHCPPEAVDDPRCAACPIEF